MLCDPGEHAWSDLVPVMKGENVVWEAWPLQCAM